MSAARRSKEEAQTKIFLSQESKKYDFDDENKEKNENIDPLKQISRFQNSTILRSGKLFFTEQNESNSVKIRCTSSGERLKREITGQQETQNVEKRRRHSEDSRDLRKRMVQKPFIPVATKYSEYREEDDQELIELEGLTIPVATIIRSDIDGDYEINPRLKVMGPEYKSEVPKSCNEAIRAQQFGSLVNSNHRWPGIPFRRFSAKDMDEFAQGKEDWPIQAIFDGGLDRRGRQTSMVYYEGWSAETISVQPTDSFRSTAPEMIQEAEVLREFMKTQKARAKAYFIEKSIEESEKIDIFESDFVEMLPKPKDGEDLIDCLQKTYRNGVFWIFQDISYFHTMANKEHGMAPVHYLACTGHNVMPPYYAYTTVNIIDQMAYAACLQQPANTTFSKLLGQKLQFGTTNTVCENPDGCICDARFNLLYHRKNRCAQSLKYTSESCLDLSNFEIERHRIVMECSDACGCSSKCARRRLQRGQQVPLVVYYESNFKGFGLRAAAAIRKGDLICEYTGELVKLSEEELRRGSSPEPETAPKSNIFRRKTGGRRVKQHVVKEIQRDEQVVGEPPEVNTADTSYDAVFNLMDKRIVIRALNKGNAARFANHSCSPNSVFVEVYSRRFESDPLIPRIGVYAFEDIELGEEITVDYWCDSNERDAKSGVKCECQASNCIQFLPAEL